MNFTVLTKKGDKYEREVKDRITDLAAQKTKTALTSQEFESLKQKSMGKLLRTTYELSKKPRICYTTYQGELEGFSRIEVEFASEKEAKEFQPPSWFGREITGTILANDKDLARSDMKTIAKLVAQGHP